MEHPAAPPSAGEPAVSRVIDQNQVWLTVGREIATAAGPFMLRGHIRGSSLGPQSRWHALPATERDALERRLLAQHREELETAFGAAEKEIAAFLEVCVFQKLQPKLRRLRDQWASGTLDLAAIGPTLQQTLHELQARDRQRNLAEQIGQRVKLSGYPDTFPARRRPRKIVAVLGPTNSGKTYDAFQRLATAETGIYLGPLRLLALEAFTRLNEEFGVSASLITGEERRIVEGSRVTASTIEMLDPTQAVEVAVIDEIQMLHDPERGWAWTQAVVGANAAELWCLGSLSAQPAIKALASRLGLPLEIRRKERKHPLVVGQPLASQARSALRQVRPGDALIVFSRRDALNLRDDLLGLGKSVACIYGALSPEVREREAHRFANGDAAILVATDAIGMGLNLPIERVVFTSVQKYDGVDRADLPVPLLQQIAGRAGRYGHQEEEGVVAGLTPNEHRVVARLMGTKQPPIPARGFRIAATAAYLEQIAEMSGDNRLEALLSLFLHHADSGDGFFSPHVPEEQLARAAFLDRLKGMSLALKHIFSMAPMSIRDEDMDAAWRDWAYAAHRGKPVRLNFIPEVPERATLAEAETTVRLLAAYRWFGYRLPEIFTGYGHAEPLLAPWIAAVDGHLRSRHRQGVGGGRGGLPSWYWGSRG
ncbi:MAG TPA: helicase-related protein [Rhodocyclaceae bacterium]|nr:helicase-related protein [Rhodocyclaceae bacterium]